MPLLHLLELACEETESVFVQDRCRISLRMDGERNELHRIMSVGERWSIQRAYPFRESVEVVLWELDASEPPALNAHDKLGTVRIDASNEGEQEHVFTRRGARYVLRYRVEP